MKLNVIRSGCSPTGVGLRPVLWFLSHVRSVSLPCFKRGLVVDFALSLSYFARQDFSRIFIELVLIAILCILFIMSYCGG